MSTKFTALGTKGCNPKVPLHIVDAAYSRHSAINDIAAAKNRQANPPGPYKGGGRGTRRLRRSVAKAQKL